MLKAAKVVDSSQLLYSESRLSFVWELN